MRTTPALVLGLTMMLAGCGGGPVESPVESPIESPVELPVESAADCSVMVRFEGRHYVGHWFTDDPADRLDRAELARCHDVGDGAGQAFPDDPEWVETRALEGFDPREVVVVALPTYASWQVMLADDAPDGVRERLEAELG